MSLQPRCTNVGGDVKLDGSMKQGLFLDLGFLVWKTHDELQVMREPRSVDDVSFLGYPLLGLLLASFFGGAILVFILRKFRRERFMPHGLSHSFFSILSSAPISVLVVGLAIPLAFGYLGLWESGFCVEVDLNVEEYMNIDTEEQNMEDAFDIAFDSEMNRKQESASTRRLAGTWTLDVIYKAKDTSKGIFTEQALGDILHFENSIVQYPGYDSHCLLDETNNAQCLPPESVLFFFPGNNIPPQPAIDNVTIALAKAGLDWWGDKDFSARNMISQHTRTAFRGGVPRPKGGQVISSSRNWLLALYEDVLNRAANEDPYKHITVTFYERSVLLNHELSETLGHDAIWSIGSFVICGIILVLQLRSAILTLVAAVCVLLSFIATYYFHFVIGGFTKLSVLDFLSLFLIAGIAADDVLVVKSTYANSAAVLGPLAKPNERLVWTCRKAAGAMLITTATTCSSFYSLCFSSVRVLQSFGFFMGTMVFCNYVNAVVIFPSALLICETRRPLCFLTSLCCRRHPPQNAAVDSASAKHQRMSFLDSIAKSPEAFPMLPRFFVQRFAPCVWYFRYLLIFVLVSMAASLGLWASLDFSFEGGLVPKLIVEERNLGRIYPFRDEFSMYDTSTRQDMPTLQVNMSALLGNSDSYDSSAPQDSSLQSNINPTSGTASTSRTFEHASVTTTMPSNAWTATTIQSISSTSKLLQNDSLTTTHSEAVVLSKDECENTICHNNSICNKSTGLCECSPGWYGNSCEHQYCPGQPACNGQGTCSEGKCICDSTFGGEACRWRQCPNCVNNGTCIVRVQDIDDDTWGCLCGPNSTGPRCENLVCPNNCSDSGSCDPRTGSCKCYLGLGGPDCSEELPPMHPIDKCIEVGLVFGISGYDSRSHPLYDRSFVLKEAIMQEWLLEVCRLIRADASLAVRDDFPCWIETFRMHVGDLGIGFPVPAANFTERLPFFLRNSNSGRFRGNVDTLSHQYARLPFRINHIFSASSSTLWPEYDRWTTVVQRLNAQAPPGGNIIMVSPTWTGIVNEKSIITSSVLAFAVSILLTVICASLLIGNLISVAFVGLNVVLITITLFAVATTILAWDFGAVQVVSLTTFVGLSVDYLVHICHAYECSLENTSRLKAVEALGQIGTALFGGALTTAGSTIFLYPCWVYLFHQIGILLFANVVIAFLYTMLVLVPLLMTLGPTGDCGNLYTMLSCLCFCVRGERKRHEELQVSSVSIENPATVVPRCVVDEPSTLTVGASNTLDSISICTATSQRSIQLSKGKE